MTSALAFLVLILPGAARADWGTFEEAQRYFVQVALGRESRGYGYQDAAGSPVTAEAHVDAADGRIVFPSLGSRAPRLALATRSNVAAGVISWKLHDAETGELLGDAAYQLPADIRELAPATWREARFRILELLVRRVRRSLDFGEAEAQRFAALSEGIL